MLLGINLNLVTKEGLDNYLKFKEALEKEYNKLNVLGDLNKDLLESIYLYNLRDVIEVEELAYDTFKSYYPSIGTINFTIKDLVDYIIDNIDIYIEEAKECLEDDFNIGDLIYDTIFYYYINSILTKLDNLIENIKDTIERNKDRLDINYNTKENLLRDLKGEEDKEKREELFSKLGKREYRINKLKNKVLEDTRELEEYKELKKDFIKDFIEE